MEVSQLLERVKVLEGGKSEGKKGKVGTDFIGREVLVRTYSAGVHFGKLLERSGTEAVVGNAQRVHYWDGAASLSQIAEEGLKKKSRISMAVKKILLTEVIELIPFNEKSLEDIRSKPIWKVTDDGEVVND